MISAADGVGLNLVTHGLRRERLMFLHGVTRRWQTFRPLLGSLSAQYQTELLDFRGHGESERDAGSYRVIDYVGDAVAALRSKAPEPAIVYGHSLGAMVGAAAAAAEPSLVSALVLEDPPFETMGSRIGLGGLVEYFRELRKYAGSGPEIADLAARLANIPAQTAPDGAVITLGQVRGAASLRFTAANLLRLDPRTLDSVVEGRWLDGYSLEKVASSIKCPVLLVQAGGASGMLKDEDAERFEKNCRDCTRVRLGAAGHAIHWEAPQALLGAVLSFLSSVDPRPGRA